MDSHSYLSASYIVSPTEFKEGYKYSLIWFFIFSSTGLGKWVDFYLGMVAHPYNPSSLRGWDRRLLWFQGQPEVLITRCCLKLWKKKKKQDTALLMYNSCTAYTFNIVPHAPKPTVNFGTFSYLTRAILLPRLFPSLSSLHTHWSVPVDFWLLNLSCNHAVWITQNVGLCHRLRSPSTMFSMRWCCTMC